MAAGPDRGRASARLAVLVAVLAFSTVAVAGGLAWRGALAATADSRAAAATAFATDVATEVARTAARAVAAGLPLEGLYGVPAYLAAEIAGASDIAAIAILDPAGTPLFAVGTTAATRPASVPIAVDGTTVGSVVVTPGGTNARALSRRGLAFVLGVSLVAALGAGLACRLFLLEAFELPARRLAAAAGSLGRGAVVRPPRTGPEILAPLARTLDAEATRLGRTLADARTLLEDIETIDHRGRLAGRLTPIAQALAAWRVIEPRAITGGWGFTGWWALPALAGLGALPPVGAALLAGQHTPGLLDAGAAMALAASAAVLVLAVLPRVPARPAGPVGIAGLALGAAALGAAPFLGGDPLRHLALAVAAGAVVAAVTALLVQPGAFRRRALIAPAGTAALVAAGPGLGGLLAAFAGPGAAALALAAAWGAIAFRLLLQLSGSAGAPPLRWSAPAAGESLALLSAGLAGAAALVVLAGGGAGAGGGLALPVLGAAVTGGLVLPAVADRAFGPTPRGLSLAILAGAAVLAVEAAGLLDPAVFAGLLGAVTGTLLHRSGKPAFSPAGGLLAGSAAAGTGLAAIAAGLVPGVPFGAIAGLMLLALALLATGRVERRRWAGLAAQLARRAGEKA